MLRFGIMHDRTVYPLDERPAGDDDCDEERVEFPAESPSTDASPPSGIGGSTGG